MTNNKKVSDTESLMSFLWNNLTSVIKKNTLLKMQLWDSEIKEDLRKQNSHLEQIQNLLQKMENI